MELETKELELPVGFGTSYTFWTFGGKVPGKFIGVHQGALGTLTVSGDENTDVCSGQEDIREWTAHANACATSRDPARLRTVDSFELALHKVEVRRLVALVLSLAMTALALTMAPAAIAATWLTRSGPSSVSSPSRDGCAICTAERASRAPVASSPGRGPFDALSAAAGSSLAGQRRSFELARQLSPRSWIADRRASVRRVCRPFAPPEPPPELAAPIV